jgi:AcrR family transcriptional regulator
MTARIPSVAAGNKRGAEAEARVRRILKVAQRMFVEHGFHHTSLDDILARSGGSKATLRKYFGNKAGVLAAVLAAHAEARMVDARGAVTTHDPEAALAAFGKVLMSFYVQPDALIIYRSVIAEGYRHPAVARGLYLGGHARIVAGLSSMLREWHEQGQVQSPDPDTDAEIFLNMLRSGAHERGLLGLQKEFSPGAIRKHVAAVVRIFWRGIRNK